MLSLVGIALLAVPAISLNGRKRTLDRIRGILGRRRGAGRERLFDGLVEELEAELRADNDRWRKSDEICLFAGYGLNLGAALLRVMLPG